MAHTFNLIVDKGTRLCRMPGVESARRELLKESRSYKIVVVSTAGRVWYNNAGRHYSKAHFEVFFYSDRIETAETVTYRVPNCIGVSWDKRNPENPVESS